MTTATLDLEDPFADPVTLAVPQRDRWLSGGRYRYPNRDGSHHSGGWTRVTNITGAISDAFGLRDWELRNLLCGIALDATIYADAVRLAARAGNVNADLKPYMEQVRDLLDRAKEAAGGNRGSDHGTREHAMVEAYHRDLPYEADVDARHRLRLYAEAMAGAQLTPVPGMQERRVMIEWANACGTLDNVLQCLVYAIRYVGDLKTQRKFWTWLEVEAQQAAYNHADAMWETTPDGGRWIDMPEVDRGRAAILWVPRPELDEVPRAEVRQVDTERGWDSFRLGCAIYTRRSEAKSTKQAISGLGWTPAPPVPRMEWYARLIASVDTMEDGQRVCAEARAAGVWCPALADVAQVAVERIRAQRVALLPSLG